MATPAEVRALYRSILRAARAMPTLNRRRFVEHKARAEFKANAGVTNAEHREFLVKLAEISLDNVRAQAEHLRRTNFDHEFDLPKKPGR